MRYLGGHIVRPPRYVICSHVRRYPSIRRATEKVLTCPNPSHTISPHRFHISVYTQHVIYNSQNTISRYSQNPTPSSFYNPFHVDKHIYLYKASCKRHIKYLASLNFVRILMYNKKRKNEISINTYQKIRW
jgi:hypothetical protein